MKKINLIIFAIFLGILLSFPKKTFAEQINSFDVNVVAHKDGSMDVTENIDYDFQHSYRHGIYRDIPLYSKVGDLYREINITNVEVTRNGKSEKNEITSTKDQISFKIGNANKELTGEHLYKISYHVQNAIGSNFPDHDEIYWNATGNDWLVTIQKASITISNDFNAVQNNFLCFEGANGATDRSCNVLENSATSSQILYPGYGLTAVASYPKGTFPPSTLIKELPKTLGEKIDDFVISHLFYIYLILNILVPIGIFIWYEKHKNKKRFGKPSVNFDIPKDEKGKRLAPALSGTIDNARLDRNDITATIFDLAIRKYIKLSEDKTTRKLLPDKKTQMITKLKEADDNLENFEKTLFNRLFEDGDSVKLSDLKSDFYKTFQSMETEVFDNLVKRKYYVRNPKIEKSFLAIAAVVCLFSLNIILGLTFLMLSRKLIGRTSLGDEIDYKIDGLKLFLGSMNRNYNWQAEKFYTVEQMIPYAMSLGFIDEFMQQLKIIKPDYSPVWYVGYPGNFYNSYGSFYTSVGSNLTTSAPSSSSGMSGGFSGGGGGGGGGGSW